MDNNYSIVPVSELENLTPAAVKKIDITAMKEVLSEARAFQGFCRSEFIQNHDYGIVPGCKKPSLLKPGAEKVFKGYRTIPTFEIIKEIEDFETRFFFYKIKCKLICQLTGKLDGEGFGICSTGEKKYDFAGADKFVLANTVLKMAKKRAMVDAALTIGCLSEIFTQDVEDMDLSGGKVAEKIQAQQKQVNSQKDTRLITEGQSKRMFAIAKGDRAKIDTIIKKYNYISSKDVQRCDYENICSELEGIKLTPATATEEEENWPTDEDYAGAFTNSKEENPF